MRSEYQNCSVDLVHYLHCILEEFNSGMRKKGFDIWPDVVKEFVFDLVKEYCTIMEKACKSDNKFMPGALPPLAIIDRSMYFLIAIEKLLATGTKKGREAVKGLERVFNKGKFVIRN
eukprot:TRINITY_DN21675_c0_g1_i2.p1 TRINITY_DN21675_c0_g1~~TRINITY_DN21675_c0_g1_i2.p1  ORF type:complete len:117 (-),score=15.94 TRINITY_DN21675_c0_g1_i2:186-536(-)